MLHRPSLMILREFAGANQGPDKFAKPGFPIATLRENGFQFLYFISGGLAAERGEVKLAENLLVGCTGFEQLRQAAIRSSEAVYIGRSSQDVHRLAEVGLV